MDRPATLDGVGWGVVWWAEVRGVGLSPTCCGSGKGNVLQLGVAPSDRSLLTTILRSRKGPWAGQESRDGVPGNCKGEEAALPEPGLRDPFYHHNKTGSQKAGGSGKNGKTESRNETLPN